MKFFIEIGFLRKILNWLFKLSSDFTPNIKKPEDGFESKELDEDQAPEEWSNRVRHISDSAWISNSIPSALDETKNRVGRKGFMEELAPRKPKPKGTPETALANSRSKLSAFFRGQTLLRNPYEKYKTSLKRPKHKQSNKTDHENLLGTGLPTSSTKARTRVNKKKFKLPETGGKTKELKHHLVAKNSQAVDDLEKRSWFANKVGALKSESVFEVMPGENPINGYSSQDSLDTGAVHFGQSTTLSDRTNYDDPSIAYWSKTIENINVEDSRPVTKDSPAKDSWIPISRKTTPAVKQTIKTANIREVQRLKLLDREQRTLPWIV